MRAIAVIPARLESQRLPRKVLLAETGRPLILHVVDQVRRAQGLCEVVVATDTEAVAEVCAAAGVRAVMTDAAHASGTDRVAEAARRLAAEGLAFDAVVNVQGDEPELPPSHIERLLELLGEGAPMASLCEPIAEEAEAQLSQVVKVVLDARGRALYFSRARLPFPRSEESRPLRHVGLYGFQAEVLQRFTRLPSAELERVEGLEQLRALSHGIPIHMGLVAALGGRGIDTPEDYAAFVARWREGRQ